MPSLPDYVGFQEFCLLRHKAMSVSRSFGGTGRLQLQGQNKPSFAGYLLLAGFLCGFFFGPAVEAICSSETSADSQQTTWCFIPEE
jgi:hypothetical protein